MKKMKVVYGILINPFGGYPAGSEIFYLDDERILVICKGESDDCFGWVMNGHQWGPIEIEKEESIEAVSSTYYEIWNMVKNNLMTAQTENIRKLLGFPKA